MTIPATVQLDQQIIDAGRALAQAQRSDPRDQGAIDAARTALQELRAQRWPSET